MIEFNFNITLIGLIIFGLLIYGFYRGYKRGAITMIVSLSILFVSLIIAAGLGFAVSIYFYKNTQSQVPQVFGAIILLLIFGVGIILSNLIQKKVFVKIKDNDPTDNTSEIIGGILGFIKYFVIAGVFSLGLNYLDQGGNFLPQSEKEGKFFKGTAWVMTHTVRILNFPARTTGPYMPKPNPQITVIKNNNTKNNNTQNTNNNPQPPNPQNKQQLVIDPNDSKP